MGKSNKNQTQKKSAKAVTNAKTAKDNKSDATTKAKLKPDKGKSRSRSAVKKAAENARINKTNPIRKLYEKHPPLRRIIDTLDYRFPSELGLWCAAFVLIVLIAILAYKALPDDIRVPITGIISVVLSSIVIPAVLNDIKTRNERKDI